MKKGFTLIELLVVIAILGVLTSIVVSSLNTARDKAKAAQAQIELNELAKIFFEVQTVTNQTLSEITGTTCTFCPCVTIGVESAQCESDWISAIDALTAAAGYPASNAEQYYTDPWGSPYLLDENEGETISHIRGPDPCYKDAIGSAGPDRATNYFETPDATSVDNIVKEGLFYNGCVE